MTVLDHEAYCAQLIAETEGLREALRGADLSATVPTCPDWTLFDLARHVGVVHRRAETVVRTRRTEYLPEEEVPGGTPPENAEGLDRWLAEGAEQLSATLREAGPDTEVWTWSWHRNSGFWARRVALETLVHRADAVLAVGGEYQAPPEFAADALDEWLELITWPPAAEFKTELKELPGSGQTLHLHATDTEPALAAEWFIERGPQQVTWRREHAKGDVALRGPLTDIMLVFFRRLPPDSEGLQVIGDRALLEHWLEHTSF